MLFTKLKVIGAVVALTLATGAGVRAYQDGEGKAPAREAPDVPKAPSRPAPAARSKQPASPRPATTADEASEFSGKFSEMVGQLNQMITQRTTDLREENAVMRKAERELKRLRATKAAIERSEALKADKDGAPSEILQETDEILQEIKAAIAEITNELKGPAAELRQAEAELKRMIALRDALASPEEADPKDTDAEEKPAPRRVAPPARESNSGAVPPRTYRFRDDPAPSRAVYAPAPVQPRWAIPAPASLVFVPGSKMRVEVLEALPGRPITGERRVHPDGTISLDFYGDLYVAGLNRREVKEKVITHLKKFLSDEKLGLLIFNDSGRPVVGEDGKAKTIEPANSDCVFVEEVFDEKSDQDRRLTELERKIDLILEKLDTKGRD